jgi:glutamyl/glutaminyl-tRNA synthetase
VNEEIVRDSAAVAKHLSAAGIDEHLAAWRDRLSSVEPFDAASLEAALRDVADARGIKAGTLIHATRVAITGQAVSPGLFEVIELMGRERVLERLSSFVTTEGRR